MTILHTLPLCIIQILLKKKNLGDVNTFKKDFFDWPKSLSFV